MVDHLAGMFTALCVMWYGEGGERKKTLKGLSENICALEKQPPNSQSPPLHTYNTDYVKRSGRFFLPTHRQAIL